MNLSKALIAIMIFSTGVVSANYVSVIDSKSAGGIIVEKEQVPVGSIQMWGTPTPPDGWLELNGQSTSGYPDLAKLYGATVPDMRGSFARGWDNGKGYDSGRSLRSFQNDADQRLTGSYNTDDRGARNATGVFTSKGSSWDGGAEGTDGNSADVTFDSAYQVRTATESRPKNVALMYIIKAENK